MGLEATLTVSNANFPPQKTKMDILELAKYAYSGIKYMNRIIFFKTIYFGYGGIKIEWHFFCWYIKKRT